MLFSFSSARIWFYRDPIDFRKGLNGLLELIASELKSDPGNRDIYLFRSRNARSIKMVFWQDDGFWLCQKRLEGKRFRFPEKGCETMALTTSQMTWLLSGLQVKHAPSGTSPPAIYY
jgi:transposase